MIQYLKSAKVPMKDLGDETQKIRSELNEADRLKEKFSEPL